MKTPIGIGVNSTDMEKFRVQFCVSSVIFMGKVITLFETREGLGQSLIGINLAISISSQIKEKVAIADFNLSGENEIALLLNFKPNKSAIDIIPLLDKLDEKLIKGYLSVHHTGVAVLGGIDRTKKALVEPRHISQIIKLISSAYPYTIVSTSKEYDDNIVSVFDSSDLILLILAPHLLSLNQARIFFETLKGWHFPLNMVKVVINMSNLKSALPSKKIEDYLGVKIFSELPYEPEIIVPSINDGIPAILSAPHSSFSRGIKNLAQQLLSEKTFEGIDKSVREKISVETVVCDCDTKKDTSAAISEKYSKLKEKIHNELISELDLKSIDLKGLTDTQKMESVRETTKKIIEDLISREGEQLSRDERTNFVEELLDEVLGLGCLENYLKDPEVTEIMVNGPDDIYIEKKGKIYLTDSKFTSTVQLLTVIDRIVSPIGRRVDESSPLVDARLFDGSRVNVIIPPLSLIGPSVTIRKFAKKKLEPEDFVRFGSVTPAMVEFLRICVRLRKNVVISGGTGSGKTTLLNMVSSFIPTDERIVTIEDSAELKLPQRHVVRLESRPSSIEGTGEIPIRRLVINALRMRPDRIVVGECRGGEALDMLQAMNTGHDGSLTTVHANSPKDAISRLTTLVIMAGTELPEKAIREQIGSAIQIIVQLSRLSDGSRKIIDISEITGIKSDAIEIMPLFKFEQSGIQDGKVIGKFVATGALPTFMNEIETHGLTLDKKIFNKGERSE
ncbi:MAG: ATPase, T2SS/T4P/T4SS family [Elusimicrobiota bacterium]